MPISQKKELQIEDSFRITTHKQSHYHLVTIQSISIERESKAERENGV